MDWKQVLGGVAPTLATALSVVGGPAGMVAGAALRAVSSAVLGHDQGTSDQVTQAIQAGLSPDAIAALQKADNDFKVQMAQIQADTTKAALQAETDKMKVLADDTANARQREVSTKDVTTRILAFMIVASFIAMVFATLDGLSKVDGAMAGTLIGYLSAKCEQVVHYYFGSTADSRLKTEIIGKSSGNASKPKSS
jgi:hypothetical protein